MMNFIYFIFLLKYSLKIQHLLTNRFNIVFTFHLIICSNEGFTNPFSNKSALRVVLTVTC